MRVTELHIDGFGRFHGLGIQDLSPGLSVFLGQNESGKSTLLAFLRAVLFGFPDGRSNENPYPPLEGGRHGGRLGVVCNHQGAFLVERHQGPRGGKVEVHGPGGIVRGRESLDRLLGMANRSLFRSVFAFGLTELQSFETLRSENVGEALYGAGAGLDPAALSRLKAILERREGEMFKPGGTRPAINRILARLSAIQKEKKTLSGSVRQYDENRTMAARMEERIRGLEERRIALSARHRQVERRIQLWPDWIDLTRAKRKLESLPVIERFPPQGLQRFENLKARLQDARKELIEKQGELDRQESERAALGGDTGILDAGARIRELQKGLGHFDAVLQDLLSARQELSDAEGRLGDALMRLGPAWSEDRVLGFDLSIVVREEVRHFKGAVQEAEWEIRKKEAALDDLLSRIGEEEEGIASLPETAGRDLQLLAGMKGALTELKRLEAMVPLLQGELRHVRERLDEQEEEKKVFEEERAGVRSLPSLWPAPAIITTGVLFLAWYGIREEWGLAAPVGGFCILAGLGLWALRFEGKRREGERLAVLDQRILRLEDAIREGESSALELKEALSCVRTEESPHLEALQLKEMPDPGDMDRMKSELSEEIRVRERRIEAEAHLSKLGKKRDETQRELEQARSGAEKMRERWREHLRELGLDPALSPDGVLETFSILEACRGQAMRVGGLRERIGRLEETRDRYLRQVNDVLAILKRPPVAEDDARVAMHDLIREYSRVEQDTQKRAFLDREIDASRRAVERLAGLAARLQTETESLMNSADSTGEDAFRDRAIAYEERRALEEKRERLEQSIERICGGAESMDGVMETLAGLELQDLEEDRDGLEGDLEKTGGELDRLKGEHARLEEQNRQLVQEEKISELRTEEEALKERLASLAGEWSVNRIAQALMRMARARYERERQPEVIREASLFFERLTRGRYPSIVAPLGEDRVEVVCRDNTRKGLDVLSRGTAEQLYLSLRFGFIRAYSKRAEPLPVVMDEILVNFDPERARTAAEAILELSRENQVLYFTCHPRTADLFRDAQPRAPVYEITEQGRIESRE
ncbi:MAG: AAA family ATPase [Deltaproteobacteria bacterium]|nr:AAA family ATPase [Deltaproteobacteria bacterium]